MGVSGSITRMAKPSQSKAKVGKAAKGPGKNRDGASHHSMNPNRPKDSVKGVGNVRSAGTIKRLQMYRCSKARRNKDGKIIKPAAYQSHVNSGTRARLEPSRAWFSNTKVIGQSALQKFQDEMAKAEKDPYQVVMRKTNLPVTLLNETAKHQRVHILDTESFENTFGKKSHRKRPRLATTALQDLIDSAAKAENSYDAEKDKDLVDDNVEGLKDAQRENIFGAGMSKRIWNELYKVIDSSDVVIQVLDARDPMGTRSQHIEKYMKSEKTHKHLIFVLNKVDLVPTWVTQKWVALLSAEYPTVAFHASLKHPFGKGAIIALLRQFGKLHKESKQISVGFIGFPNVGKSSVINAIRAKKVCKVAPLAGETKVWQYITLFRKVYLIDCPGVVYSGKETDEEKVLKGVVRVEMVDQPYDYIPTVLQRVKREYLARTYRIERDWKSTNDFLERIAQRSGKLLKGGEPDLDNVAKMVLNDWQRGKLPFFTPPPGCEQFPQQQKTSEGDTEANGVAGPPETEKMDQTDQPSPEGQNDESPDGQTAPDTASESGSSVKKVMQDQDFRKIRVVLDYDEEDRRGDPALKDQPVQSDSEPEDNEGEEKSTVGQAVNEDGSPAKKAGTKSDSDAKKGRKKGRSDKKRVRQEENEDREPPAKKADTKPDSDSKKGQSNKQGVAKKHVEGKNTDREEGKEDGAPAKQSDTKPDSDAKKEQSDKKRARQEENEDREPPAKKADNKLNSDAKKEQSEKKGVAKQLKAGMKSKTPAEDSSLSGAPVKSTASGKFTVSDAK